MVWVEYIPRLQALRQPLIPILHPNMKDIGFLQRQFCVLFKGYLADFVDDHKQAASSSEVVTEMDGP
jgi:hypothetical protein